MIAILGTPCGGTVYTTRVLRAHGIDVGHERLGPAGGVCGFAALGGRQRASTPTWAYDARAHRVTIRLIRHPLDVAETLPSVLYLSLSAIGAEARELRPQMRAALSALRALPRPAGRQWYQGAPRRRPPHSRVEVPDDDSATALVRLALRYWVETHGAIPGDAPVLRVDRFAEDWLDVAPRLGLEPTLPTISPMSKGLRWPRWTWSRWEAEDPESASRARALVERYQVDERVEAPSAAPAAVNPRKVPAELLALRAEVAALRAEVAAGRER